MEKENKSERIVYMDNAATTKVSEEVMFDMKPFFEEYFENPSTSYRGGQSVKQAVQHSRSKIANRIGANVDEIYFTSGGSESDNWALRGIAEAYKDKGKHIITTKIEHHAILNTCKYLEEHGYEITYLDVDEGGRINLDDLERAIRPDTILVSIMMANNEIGTVQPIQKIGKICLVHDIVFHTDAVQAVGHIPIDVRKLHVDLLSSSAHKIHGTKGIGFLYKRRGVKIEPLIYGGRQETGLRAGTENVAGIVGYGTAVDVICQNMHDWNQKEKVLINYMCMEIGAKIPDVKYNGHKFAHLPNILNVSFEGVDSESLMLLLDSANISVSSGSACTTGSLEPSHVLKAIGLSDDLARSAIRFSISEETTQEDVDYVIENLVKFVTKLRSLRE